MPLLIFANLGRPLLFSSPGAVKRPPPLPPTLDVSHPLIQFFQIITKKPKPLAE